MKDIQKIKEFFSQPMKESLTGGYPHTKTSGENFEKITITEPIDDDTKNKMIKNFRAEGWDAKPNNGGGITAIKKTSMEEAKFMSGLLSGKDFINACHDISDGGLLVALFEMSTKELGCNIDISSLKNNENMFNVENLLSLWLLMIYSSLLCMISVCLQFNLRLLYSVE